MNLMIFASVQTRKRKISSSRGLLSGQLRTKSFRRAKPIASLGLPVLDHAFEPLLGVRIFEIFRTSAWSSCLAHHDNDSVSSCITMPILDLS